MPCRGPWSLHLLGGSRTACKTRNLFFVLNKVCGNLWEPSQEMSQVSTTKCGCGCVGVCRCVCREKERDSNAFRYQLESLLGLEVRLVLFFMQECGGKPNFPHHVSKGCDWILELTQVSDGKESDETGQTIASAPCQPPYPSIHSTDTFGIVVFQSIPCIELKPCWPTVPC